MSRFMHSPGAFYSYIVAGLGRIPGLSGAFTAIGAYTAFIVCSFAYGGLLANHLVEPPCLYPRRAEGVSARPFTLHAFTSGSLSVGLLFGALCITRFEAVAVFREETRDPVKTVPRATYTAVIFMCGLYGPVGLPHDVRASRRGAGCR
jgi:amino acid transporter